MTLRGLAAGLARVTYVRLLVAVATGASALAAWATRRADEVVAPVIAAVSPADPPRSWLETVPPAGNA
jgi:hypothetical protein